MPEYVYQLRHMFNGLRDGQVAPTFFTRDNEQLLGELPEAVQLEAIAKGWMTRTEVPTLRDMREVNKELLDEAKHDRGGEKKSRGSR